MATVQTDYGNVSENVPTTRPKVTAGVTEIGSARRIVFDDTERARGVARQLAALLGCSPDDFGYGEQPGKPIEIEIEIEDTIIECALAIAHLCEGLPLRPRPADG